MKKTKSICILVDSLSSGGAEKISANLSISLSNIGYAVTIVSMANQIDYNFKGELFNFGLIKEKYSRVKAFLIFRNFFKKAKFDVIIDQRIRNKFWKEFLFSRLVFNMSYIVYCIHCYKLSYYFPLHSVPFLYKLAFVKKRVFVSVSKEIKYKVKQHFNIDSVVIYNYSLIPKGLNKLRLDSTQNYIISVGRLTKIKQHATLIKSYKMSKLPDNSIKLIILGDGEEKNNLIKLISKLQLKDKIKLLPFNDKPYALINGAKALVLTSKNEGFPMVLIEALQLGTPVVSFNCKSGPSEIITNNFNGVLVKNQDTISLANGLNKLLLNKDYYNTIKDNILNNEIKFTEEEAALRWNKLINSIN